MLIEMGIILRDAYKNGYGVAAPNVFDGETVRACFEAALELRAPMIIDAGGVDLEYIAHVTRFYSRKYPEVPVALNLDHGDDLKQVVQAIKAGFTSVMIDRSTAPYEDNVRDTAEVVKMAHMFGVSVEAELGHVGRGSNYKNDDTSCFTMPEEVVNFVKRTNVDCLAIAIGTAHGFYAGIPKLDFERLLDIRKVSTVPLVLHGGSSTGDDNLKKAVSQGITKVNLGTDLAMAGTYSIKNLMANKERVRISGIFKSGIEGYKAELIRYISLFGAKNRW